MASFFESWLWNWFSAQCNFWRSLLSCIWFASKALDSFEKKKYYLVSQHKTKKKQKTKQNKQNTKPKSIHTSKDTNSGFVEHVRDSLVAESGSHCVACRYCRDLQHCDDAEVSLVGLPVIVWVTWDEAGRNNYSYSLQK